jgi:hypothetical protein
MTRTYHKSDFNLSSDGLEAEPELPESDIPWLDKDVSSRVQVSEFRLTKNVTVEQLEYIFDLPSIYPILRPQLHF